MTYSYSVPASYNRPAQTVNNVNYGKNQNSASSAVLGGILIGGITGGVIGARSNPYFLKNNDVIDSFAKNAYGRYVKKVASQEEKDIYTQSNNILKRIGRTKTVEKLKELLNNNEKAKGLISGDLIDGITDTNLASNKETIKNTIKANRNENLQRLKNKIICCWDKTSKKFKQADSVDENTFNAIKKAARNIKDITITKYALVGGAIAAVTAYIIKKSADAKKM